MNQACMALAVPVAIDMQIAALAKLDESPR